VQQGLFGYLFTFGGHYDRPGGYDLKRALFALAVVGFVSSILGTVIVLGSRLTTVVTIHSYGTVVYSNETLKAEEADVVDVSMTESAYLVFGIWNFLQVFPQTIPLSCPTRGF
jgi:hypothetical protein